MKKRLYFFTATVKNYDESFYYLSSEEEGLFWVPINVMHSDYNDLHALFNDEGRIKRRTSLHMVKVIDEKGDRKFYPDQNFYGKKNTTNNTQKSLGNTSRKYKWSKTESDYEEWKESFAEEEQIIKTLTAFANAKHGGKVFVGVNDDGEAVGLPDYYINKFNLSKANSQNNFGRTYKKKILSKVNDKEFVDAIEINFFTVGKKLICLLELGSWNGGLVFYKTDGSFTLLIRKDSENRTWSEKIQELSKNSGK